MKTDNWLDEIIYNPPELNLVYTLREYQPYSEEFSDKHYKFLGPSIYERKTANLDFVKKETPMDNTTSFPTNPLKSFFHSSQSPACSS